MMRRLPCPRRLGSQRLCHIFAIDLECKPSTTNLDEFNNSPLTLFRSQIIADAVRTTLGPRGMDKLIVNAKGEATISNDGATIMKLLEIVHPAAKTLVDIAKSQVHFAARERVTSALRDTL